MMEEHVHGRAASDGMQGKRSLIRLVVLGAVLWGGRGIGTFCMSARFVLWAGSAFSGEGAEFLCTCWTG